MRGNRLRDVRRGETLSFRSTFCQLENRSRIHRAMRRLLAWFVAGSFVGDCGNSSVGRAQPCQGWGRGFESRFPLHFLLFARVAKPVDAMDLKSLGIRSHAGSI